MHLTSLQKQHEANLAKKNALESSAKSFKNSKWAEFLKPRGYKPMIVLFWFFLIQQFIGIYITLYYAVSFVQVK